jgi:N-acylglucosamine 2-epimerase
MKAIYRDGLLNDTVPFWFPRSVDRDYGGFFTSFDRHGTLIDSDKSVWFQGRFTWMLCTLYNTVEQRPEWLAYAKNGIAFLDTYCFDTDGRMFFSVTREGRPLRKRQRYIFSEAFAIIAYAAYGIASGEEKYKRKAADLFKQVLHTLETTGILVPKTDPQTRPMKALSVPMTLIFTAQELRKATNDPFYGEFIDRCFAEIERDFFKPEFSCVLETVGPKGEFYDTWDGRMVNPGHSIELGWFILEEARVRGGDRRLVGLGTKVIDGSFALGWDGQYGGLFSFRDAKGLPCTEYCHDMKFWWPHCELLIATLQAYQMTGECKYAEWHRQSHEWIYTHLPDPTCGEWFGYLHRDGSVATTLKGNLWKGFFHLPRMQWTCWQRLEEMSKNNEGVGETEKRV